jgi:hypothetical protein
VGSSDDYLMSRVNDARIYSITYKGKQGLLHKLQGVFAAFAASLGLGSRLP